RMERINPDISNIEAQDDSASGRILAWKAAFSMASDYPLGVGQGNFKKYVGQYNPHIPGKDTHNTFFRCLAELGVQGLTIYLIMIANVFRILKRVKKKAIGLSNEIDYKWHSYALSVSLIIFLASGMFITHTYIEELYWLLMFPVLLERAVENQIDRIENIPTVQI
ncbi:MAG: O-antigen ligase family protein, partial [Thermodesulfobacteriota bacterium]|nr:O-antigen ligase family protein [Thermodesulfobacteriota bacterium]